MLVLAQLHEEANFLAAVNKKIERQEADISLTDIGADSPLHGLGDAHPGQCVWLRQKRARESGRGVWGAWGGTQGRSMSAWEPSS